MSDKKFQMKLKLMSNCLRFMSLDAAEKPSRDIPMPMGMSDVATVLFKIY